MLEAGLGEEHKNHGQLAAEWRATKATLDAMILDGSFDVVRHSVYLPMLLPTLTCSDFLGISLALSLPPPP